MNQTINKVSPLNTLDSIRQRRTLKVLGNKPLPTKACDMELVETLIESAYYAPFHYPASAEHRTKLSSPLPYRFYVLDSKACRQLAEELPKYTDKTGKMLGMLNTADYMFHATWCPITDNKAPEHDNCQLFSGNLVNMEHLAAAGAAIQNLLLTATALGYENYWGSGGPLRESFANVLLNIPSSEILLGTLFIFPDESTLEKHDTEQIFSKRRDQRGQLNSLYTVVNLIKDKQKRC